MLEWEDVSERLGPQASSWAAQENENDTWRCPEGLRRSICCNLCSVSYSLSHTNLSNKVRGMFFLRSLCMSLLLSQYVFCMYMCIYVYFLCEYTTVRPPQQVSLIWHWTTCWQGSIFGGWGIWINLSLASLQGPLWFGVVAPDRVLSMCSNKRLMINRIVRHRTA